MNEFDCSGRFASSLGVTNPDEVVVLQKLVTEKRYSLPVVPTTPVACLESSMFDLYLKGPLNTSSFAKVETTTIFSRPFFTYNAFDVKPEAANANNAGIYEGKIHRS